MTITRLYPRLIPTHPDGAPAVYPQVPLSPNSPPLRSGVFTDALPQSGVAFGCVGSGQQKGIAFDVKRTPGGAETADVLHWGSPSPTPLTTTVDNHEEDRKKLIEGSAPRMGMKPRLTTVARAHGKHCLRIVHDALSDAVSPGVIDEREAPTVLKIVEAWYARDVLADEAGGLSQAIERGVETDAYLEGKVFEYRAALDGLPLSIA